MIPKSYLLTQKDSSNFEFISNTRDYHPKIRKIHTVTYLLADLPLTNECCGLLCTSHSGESDGIRVIAPRCFAQFYVS